MTEQQAHELELSTDMEPVHGTVDVNIPADVLWECFRHASWWPRWNPCMWWALNDELVEGQPLIWAFEPIQWWYLYRLPGVATLVEVEANRKVTWEVTALPGLYARHTYSIEDLGNGRSRFGSWEKASGPGFRALKGFWLTHFVFVKDESLNGARQLEAIYRQTGALDEASLPPKNYWPSIIQLIILFNIVVNVLSALGRMFKPRKSRR
jgi:hypothetical protein